MSLKFKTIQKSRRYSHKILKKTAKNKNLNKIQKRKVIKF